MVHVPFVNNQLFLKYFCLVSLSWETSSVLNLDLNFLFHFNYLDPMSIISETKQDLEYFLPSVDSKLELYYLKTTLLLATFFNKNKLFE